jgi:uncharacterized protein YjbI with pentapeptide repeats
MSSSVEPNDLTSLEKAVNDAAGKASALWLSFISLGAYLVITTGSVSHRSLLLQTDLKLPVLNADLPLVGFFVIAPLFFILFHFYIFLQLNYLARRIIDYNSLLSQQFKGRAEQRLLRHRLDSFIFVQTLSAPRERNEGSVYILPKLIAWITLVGIPLMLLLFIEFQFLPYQDEAVTWYHRGIIFLDLALILAFWPVIHGRKFKSLFSERRRLATASNVLFLIFSVFVPVFPDEAIYPYVHSPLTGLLFEGNVDQVTGRPASPFANYLIVTDQNLVKNGVTLSFRGRNLRGAILNRSDFSKADFIGAILINASMVGAKLRRAQFGCADEQQGKGCADLRNVNLTKAEMDHVNLNRALLHGAVLENATLNNAHLVGTELYGANLRFSKLEKADLTGAYLQGAALTGAQVEGAKFYGAQIDGAALIDVKTDIKNNFDDAEGTPWTREDENSPKVDDKQKVLADVLEKLACDPTGDLSHTEHIARGLIHNHLLTYLGPSITKVAKRILLAVPRPCEGATNLNRADLKSLRQQTCYYDSSFCEAQLSSGNPKHDH